MSATLFTSSKYSATDAAGLPLAFGLVYTYAAGSLTPQATYTSQSGAAPNTNPVVLDASGRANIWLGPYAYRFIVKSTAGVLMPDGDTDNITNPTASVQLTQPTTDLMTGDGVTTVYTLSANPANVNNVLFSLGGAIQVPGIDYTLSGIVITCTSPPPVGVVGFFNYTVALPIGTVTPAAVAFLQQSTGASLIGFVQSAAGSVLRTLQSKLRERVSVLDFGAIANGNINDGSGTDNSVAFQAAITSLGARGTVYVPPGTYKLVSQITVPSNIAIEGSGAYTSAVFAPAAFNADGLFKCNGLGGPPTVIRDLAIVGQVGGAGPASIGVQSIANGVMLSGLWVTGFKTNINFAAGASDNFLFDSASEEAVTGGVGIQVGSPDVTIADCEIYNCNIGVAVINVPYVDGVVTISNCRALACASTGYLLSNSSNIQLSNCSAGHNNSSRFTSAAMRIDLCTDVAVSNFVARVGSVAGTAIGILCTTSNGISITGGRLRFWNDGIALTGCSQTTISGVSVSDCGRRGIAVSGGDRTVISGCNSTYNGGVGTTDAGIFLDSTLNFASWSVTGNVCVQAGGGAQDYGIYASLTDSGANSGVIALTGNVCRFNSVADIAAIGKTQNIVLAGNVPAGATASAATVTVVAGTYLTGLAEESLIANFAGTVTLTLPAAASNTGRQIQVRTITANLVVSASANVIPVVGGVASVSILAAVAGKWASLRSDGANWQIMGSN